MPKINLSLYFLILSLIFLLGVSPLALSQGQQIIIAKIDENYNAIVEQSYPLDTDMNTYFVISVPSYIGPFNSNYEILNAHDSIGDVDYSYIDDYTSWSVKFNQYITNPERRVLVKSNEVSGSGTKDVVFIYKVPASIKDFGIVSFNFKVESAPELFKKPTLEIGYPDSLEFIGANFPYEGSNPVKIQYPDNNSLGLVTVNFVKKNLPNGLIKKEYGDFIFVGQTKHVDRTIELFSDLNFMSQMYKDLTGGYVTGKTWVFIQEFIDWGTRNPGVALPPNVFLINTDTARYLDYFEHKRYIDLIFKEIIVHEIGHNVTDAMTFGGHHPYIQWFDEGTSVFFQNHAADYYMKGPEYWLEVDTRNPEHLLFYQDIADRMTEKGLTDRYRDKKNFLYDDGGSTDETLGIYNHSGIVFTNFYLLVGEEGFREFYSRLGATKSTNCSECDTNIILGIMEEISGKTQNELLFPYRDENDFSQKIRPLVVTDYNGAEVQRIQARYLKLLSDNEITKEDLLKGVPKVLAEPQHWSGTTMSTMTTKNSINQTSKSAQPKDINTGMTTQQPITKSQPQMPPKTHLRTAQDQLPIALGIFVLAVIAVVAWIYFFKKKKP